MIDFSGQMISWNAAITGDAQAQYQVGMCFLNGNGVSSSPKSAYSWFEKAAAQGNFDGILAIADCKFYGRGLSQSQTEAVEIYRQVSKNNHPLALYRLGECAEAGIVLPRNLTDAADFYQKAAALNYPGAREAWNRVARIAKVWNPAIQGEDSSAQLELGKCYAEGDGIARDENMAFQLFLRAARQHQPEALYLAGRYLDAGIGCERNQAQAVEFYQQARALNYIPAIYELALKYRIGDGVEQNLTLAYELFQLAAAQNYQNSTAQAKELVNVGSCWVRAVNANEPEAQYQLAVCYRRGDGVEESQDKAFFWLNRSSDQRYPAAMYEWALQEFSSHLRHHNYARKALEKYH